MSAVRPAGLRVGDAERDAAVEQLNQHFADGRLTSAEREERTALALGARTAGDLHVLLADLPRLGAGDARRRQPDGRARSRHLAARLPLAGLVLVLLGLLALALLGKVFLPLVLVAFLVLRARFGWWHGRHGRQGWNGAWARPGSVSRRRW